MKNKLKVFGIALAFLFNYTSVIAQWQFTFFPNNGMIYALAVDGNTVYSGSDVFSGGNAIHMYNNSWTSGTLVPYNRITNIIFKDNIIFASVWIDGGVYVSSNGGLTWSQEYTGLPTYFSGQLANSYALVKHDTLVFVATSLGVYKTSNNGVNWVSAGLTNYDIRSLAVSGSTLYAGTFGTGAFSSADNGNTWQPINNGLSDTIVNSIVASGNTLYAGTNNGMFRSLNKGGNWTAMNNGFTADNVNTVFLKGSAIFAGTSNNKVFVSDNDGSSWTAQNTGLFPSDVLSFTARGNEIFVGTNGGGVYYRPVLEVVDCFANNFASFDSTQNTFTLSIDSSTAALATSYLWDFGDGFTSTLATPTHTYAIDSIYNVCMKVVTQSGDFCTYCKSIGKDNLGNIVLQKATSGFTINVTSPLSTSLNEAINTNVDPLVFPNPFTRQTTIHFKKVQVQASINIFDVMGRELKNISLKNSDQFILEREDLKPGMYLLLINDDANKVYSKKIIID